MGLFDNGRKHGNRFVEMLVREAGATREAIGFLESALERADAEAIEHLRGLEQGAMELRRVLIDELHKTFITPLDREDIYNLSDRFEKMVVYALTTLEEMHMMRVSADDPIRGMVALVREEAEELEGAMKRLQENPRVACDHANAVLDRERRVERLYRGAIRDLFAEARSCEALPAIFYRREVYRHISNMSDRAVSAANVLGMVVMKLA
ncbi:MAG: DUF47 domain-containing protein [Bacillota bacterium]